MSIARFFQDTLGAKLRNPQWSWGARDPRTNRVFLRVWKDQIESDPDGERVRLLLKVPRRKSHGYPERVHQLDLIRAGAEGIGVVCTAVDPKTSGVRKISEFDKTTLLQLGELIDDGGAIYARIVARLPIAELQRPRTGQSTLATDLKGIFARKRIDATVKEALVNARVGQGLFRIEVLRLWNGRCSVTESSTLDAIRASHIKPWRDSTDSERLDSFNGIPLVASLDALFDAGLISFGESGQLLVSQELAESEREIFGIAGKSLTKAPPPESAAYLAYHREHIFRK